jgi:hypothetical protein
MFYLRTKKKKFRSPLEIERFAVFLTKYKFMNKGVSYFSLIKKKLSYYISFVITFKRILCISKSFASPFGLPIQTFFCKKKSHSLLFTPLALWWSPFVSKKTRHKNLHILFIRFLKTIFLLFIILLFCNCTLNTN